MLINPLNIYVRPSMNGVGEYFAGLSNFGMNRFCRTKGKKNYT